MCSKAPLALSPRLSPRLNSALIYSLTLLCLSGLSAALARPVRLASLRLMEEGEPARGASLSQAAGRALKRALAERLELLSAATLSELIPPNLDLSACGSRCPEVIGRAVGADLVTHGALSQSAEGLRLRLIITEAATGTPLIDELLLGSSASAIESGIQAKVSAWIPQLSEAIKRAQARPLTLIGAQAKRSPQGARWLELGLEWVPIQGGRLNMGHPQGPPKERPVHWVEVSPFSLMKSEVTAAQYYACLKAGVCSAPREGEGCVSPAPHSALPMNCVSWEQAQRFASWIGARLPTEIEWAFAARGAEGRLQPWGAGPASCERVTMLGTPESSDEVDRGEGCGLGEPSPVCARPKGNSPEGLCDLVGNLWEWVIDDWHHDYRGAPMRGAWCATPDCSPQARGAKTYRGGGWYHEGSQLSATSRGFARADFQGAGVGFRCAL